MSLALLKSEVLSVLGDGYDESAWSDATLEEALRQALVFFHPYAAVREQSFTLLESGYEHNLSTLNAHEVTSIGWPWGDGYCLSNVARHWRQVSEHVIRMDDLSLDINEVVRVEFKPRHTILHLDGGSATTFWEIEQRRFVLAAGAYALRLRAIAYSHDGDDAQRGWIPALLAGFDALMAQFHTLESTRASSSHYVTWGGLGL